MLTEKEIELAKLLAKIHPDVGYMLAVILEAEKGDLVDELISFIKNEPEATSEDILNYVLSDEYFEDINPE